MGEAEDVPGEVVHTDIEGPFNNDLVGFKWFQFFVDKASREKRVVRLETRDAAVDATVRYIDDMAREGVAVKCIPGDGAIETG